MVTSIVVSGAGVSELDAAKYLSGFAKVKVL
jgi:hypothetical protein